MGHIIVYATQRDVETIREWINGEPEVGWIVKVSDDEHTCAWKVVSAIDTIEEQTYLLWHTEGGRLTIPSGDPNIPNIAIADPFAGWTTRRPPDGDGSRPLLGGIPGPYSFTFSEMGREVEGSLGRSGFGWVGDHFRLIGNPAPPAAKRWWNKLLRFVKKSSVQVPWIPDGKRGWPHAHVFPHAKVQIDLGRHRDIN